MDVPGVAIVSTLGLIVVGTSVVYLYLLVVGAIRRPAMFPVMEPGCRFAVAISAHDEAQVIGQTVAHLYAQDYPGKWFDVYVVADHCTDDTASVARRAGAVCWERSDDVQESKGTALSWLFERIWQTRTPYDAVVIFDADTMVEANFLRVMAARLAQGDRVIQGQHRISNPQDGWVPALTWAMFLIDNRFQNQGRANLGLSAKNMGDSICFSTAVLRQVGFGSGLTEDYDLRFGLLLSGIRIAYEPAAVGLGEAPANWGDARRQRERWLAGTYQSNCRYLAPMLRRVARLRRLDWALLDGIAQVLLLPYSVLVVASVIGLVWQWVVAPAWWWLWGGLVVALFLYPFLGLALEKAPLRAYLVILTGPVFVVWRTWLALLLRLGLRSATWVRTPHRGKSRPG